MGGEYAELIRKKAEQDRAPVPKRIAERPFPGPGLALYWEAFSELNTCRGGMGGPIPWNMIAEYADRAGLMGDQYAALLYIVRALDKVALKFEKGKQGSGSRPIRVKNGSSSAGTPPPVR